MFDGSTGVTVPAEVMAHNLTRNFTISVWLKHEHHAGQDKHVKEHILCNADDHRKWGSPSVRPPALLFCIVYAILPVRWITYIARHIVHELCQLAPYIPPLLYDKENSSYVRPSGSVNYGIIGLIRCDVHYKVFLEKRPINKTCWPASKFSLSFLATKSSGDCRYTICCPLTRNVRRLYH